MLGPKSFPLLSTNETLTCGKILNLNHSETLGCRACCIEEFAVCGEVLDCMKNIDFVIYLLAGITGGIYLVIALYSLALHFFKGKYLR